METALPLQQHPHFAAALAVLGRPVQRIALSGAAPVVAVKICGQLIASRGPVWQHSPDPAVLAQSGLRAVNLDRPAPALMRAAGFHQIATTAYVAELDLTAAGSDTMTGKWRNIWRRACEAPVVIRQEPFDPVAHAWLCAADIAQQKAKRFRSLPHRLIGAYATTARDAATVFVAYQDRTPLAAMLFLAHAPVVTYHLGWTGDAGRKWGLHHRLLFAAATHFASAGFIRLDLGIVETDTAPGLARFKIGSGARVRPLGGTWLRLSGRPSNPKERETGTHRLMRASLRPWTKSPKTLRQAAHVPHGRRF